MKRCVAAGDHSSLLPRTASIIRFAIFVEKAPTTIRRLFSHQVIERIKALVAWRAVSYFKINYGRVCAVLQMMRHLASG